MNRLKRLIEKLLPWYDAKSEAAKDERLAQLTQRVEAVAKTPDGLRAYDTYQLRRR